MLAPEYQPITFSFGFIDAPLEIVSEGLLIWYKQQSISHKFKQINDSFPEILHLLEPLSAPFFKRLWIKTSSSKWKTAYFDGFVNGGDPFPPISELAIRLKTNGIVVVSQPDTKHCYGANKLELYGPIDTEWLNLVWEVSAFNDGDRWVWQRTGQIQPFEETATYKSRKIKDRFTKEMLVRYCNALSIPLDVNNYGP
jgi:hypothetical protein